MSYSFREFQAGFIRSIRDVTRCAPSRWLVKLQPDITVHILFKRQPLSHSRRGQLNGKRNRWLAFLPMTSESTLFDLSIRRFAPQYHVALSFVWLIAFERSLIETGPGIPIAEALEKAFVRIACQLEKIGIVNSVYLYDPHAVMTIPTFAFRMIPMTSDNRQRSTTVQKSN